MDHPFDGLILLVEEAREQFRVAINAKRQLAPLPRTKLEEDQLTPGGRVVTLELTTKVLHQEQYVTVSCAEGDEG